MTFRDLFHDDVPYDPVKAHEYYLKIRQLKGRQPGAQPETVARPLPKGADQTPVVKKPVVPPPKKTAAQVQAEADAAVAALQARLTKLRAILAALVKQAQSRSGETSNATTAKKAAAKKKPETAAQKAKASAAAKKYYQEHKADTDAEKTKQLKAQIKQVEAKIKQMKADLKAAADKLKKKKKPPVSKTAAKGR